MRLPSATPVRLAVVVASLASLLVATTAGAENSDDMIPADIAVLQGLNKITARVSTFEVPVSKTVKFGTLEITARACKRTPPEDPPENAAFLEIREVKPEEHVDRKVFTGWMFSSSPALSAMEDPVYDVSVLKCKMANTSESSSSG